MVLNIKHHRRQYKVNGMNKKMSKFKAIMYMKCQKLRRNVKPITRKEKLILPPIQHNESLKEAFNSKTNNFTTKRYSFYDDLDFNSTPKPLRHPFTKKVQCVVQEKLLEQLCKSSLLEDCQSTNEARTQSLNGNDDNVSLIQPSEKSKYSCLSMIRGIQFCRHGIPLCSICNQTSFEKNNSDSKISSTDDDSDSDNDCVKSHPNRRLLVEKTNYNVFNCSVNKLQVSNTLSEPLTSVKAKTYISPQYPLVDEKSQKISEMWLDVLNSPDLSKTETSVSPHLCPTTLNVYSTLSEIANENTMDFEEMIENFQELKRRKSDELYEEKFQEKLNDLDFKHLLANFYIPPAKVELLYSKLTSAMSQQECLAQLCTEMQWPQPTYTMVSSKNSPNLFSCNLKSKSFLPQRPGQSMSLNKELAAFECLNWLGFEQKSEKNANWATKKKAYYNTITKYSCRK